MQMRPHVGDFLRDPRNCETCLRMIHEHQESTGIPPTLEALGTSIYRGMVRQGQTTVAATVTGSGAVRKKRITRKKKETPEKGSAVAAAATEEHMEEEEVGAAQAEGRTG